MGNGNKSATARRHRIIKLKETKGGKCSKCGYDKNYSCLDFHHLDPSTKSFGITVVSMDTHGYRGCLEESQKCVLLCRNCHTDFHFPQGRKAQELFAF